VLWILDDNPDAVMRSIAQRFRSLTSEAAILDFALSMYAKRNVGIEKNPDAVPLLEHYMFTDYANCGCSVCTEWASRREEMVRALELVPKGHKWSTCSCDVCRFVGRIHLNNLAAENTRNLLIETSFHARYHSPFGEQVMQWLTVELTDPRYTLNWRAQEMSRVSLDKWFGKCQASLGPIVSGAVFRDDMHMQDVRVHFGSSLVADGFVGM
jgi:hypothetical protein